MNKKFMPIETYLIVNMAVFGIILMLPSETFSSSPYDTMKYIAKEEHWGLLCLFISLFQLLSMVLRHNKMKIIGLCMTTFLWSSIGTTFLIESINTGVLNTGLVYFVIAGLALWLSYKIGGQSNVGK